MLTIDNHRITDLTGKKFGMLTVTGLKNIHPKTKKAYCNCVCDCGKEKTVRADSLLAGHTKSCGCALKKTLSEKRHDLVGEKFGRLTVIEYFGPHKKNRTPMYLCKCDCGKNKTVRGYNLTGNRTKSCGCGQARPPATGS